MKKKILVLAVLAILLAMVAVAWAQCSGWTISREEAQEIKQAVHEVYPYADVLFKADKDGTRVKIYPGSRSKDADLLITIDGRVFAEKYFPIYQGGKDKMVVVMNKIGAIINRSASDPTKLGRTHLK